MKGKLKLFFDKCATSVLSRSWVTKRIPSNVDIVLECHDNDRAALRDGRAYAQVLDGFQDELRSEGYTCLTLAKSGSRLIGDAYGDVISPFSLIETILIFMIRLFSNVGLGGLSKAYQRHLYASVLVRTNCVLVVGIQPTSHLVDASRKLKIPVADLLHGYGITPAHKVYGVDAMMNISENFLCTDYIALDGKSKSVIQKSLFAGNKFARCWSYSSPIMRYAASIRLADGLLDFVARYKKVFLITLQWGIDRFERKNPHVDGHLHPKILQTVMAHQEYEFGYIVKPHPVLLHNKELLDRVYKSCENCSNVWIEKEADLKPLLGLVEGHITIFSTTVREAGMLGVKSLIYSSDDWLFEGEDYHLQCELDAGMATRVSEFSIDEIFDLLRNLNVVQGDKIEKYKELVRPEYSSAAELVRGILGR